MDCYYLALRVLTHAWRNPPLPLPLLYLSLRLSLSFGLSLPAGEFAVYQSQELHSGSAALQTVAG